MPQKAIKTKTYSIDPVTGYLESSKVQLKFNASTKSRFLGAYENKRDVEEACKVVGISRRILSSHLRADKKFREDYRAIKQALGNTEARRKDEVLERLWKQANS